MTPVRKMAKIYRGVVEVEQGWKYIYWNFKFDAHQSIVHPCMWTDVAVILNLQCETACTYMVIYGHNRLWIISLGLKILAWLSKTENQWKQGKQILGWKRNWKYNKIDTFLVILDKIFCVFLKNYDNFIIVIPNSNFLIFAYSLWHTNLCLNIFWIFFFYFQVCLINDNSIRSWKKIYLLFSCFFFFFIKIPEILKIMENFPKN